MKPVAFAYERPGGLGEALAVYGEAGPGAVLLAGGQSLVPLLNLRLVRPQLVVDLGHVAGLDGVAIEDGELSLGATVRLRRLEREPAAVRTLPLLPAVLAHVAHPEIRARSTVGGSLAHLDPAAELPALALLLDARVRLRSRRGARRIAFRDFARGAFTSALAAGEMLTEVRLPLPPAGARWAVEEIARRPGDFALAGAMAAAWRDGEGRPVLRLAVFGAGPVPVRVASLEELAASGGDALANLDAVDAHLDPSDDAGATAGQRRHLARVAVRRCLERVR